MEQINTYMVCTYCMTYNHGPYIVDALNGFSMQETSFPVINIISDDASTDGEPEIILHYLSEFFMTPYREEETDDYYLICARHKTNINCTFVVFLLKYNHYSIKKLRNSYHSEWMDNAKYIAMCEGDDYWIDTHKLQKQVDFMEKFPEYGMVTSASKVYVQGKGMKKGAKGHAYRGFEDLLNGNYIYNASVLKRKSLEYNYLNEIGYSSDWKMGDWPRILYCAIVSKIGFIDEPMSVYRVLPNSASHFENFDKFKEFNENCVTVAKFFIKKYKLEAEKLNPQLDNWLQRRLLIKACSVANVDLVRLYRQGVQGLSAKEKITVFLSSHYLTNTLYVWYKKIMKNICLVLH